MKVVCVYSALQDRKNHQHKKLKMNLLSGYIYIIQNIKFRNYFGSKKLFNNFSQCLTYGYQNIPGLKLSDSFNHHCCSGFKVFKMKKGNFPFIINNDNG
ncbi:hypothetical protein IX38_20830 [Chryseobacterium luteum]|uniref:Uncharacterized protein n=1 Tax=Chryseobacterium luteum TaxID=421531 RepID=A0A085YYM9_9FLAO|nr:hypothetical protein IX38_20830 [Chryseobacterium luteum]